LNRRTSGPKRKNKRRANDENAEEEGGDEELGSGDEDEEEDDIDLDDEDFEDDYAQNACRPNPSSSSNYQSNHAPANYDDERCSSNCPSTSSNRPSTSSSHPLPANSTSKRDAKRADKIAAQERERDSQASIAGSSNPRTRPTTGQAKPAMTAAKGKEREAWHLKMSTSTLSRAMTMKRYIIFILSSHELTPPSDPAQLSQEDQPAPCETRGSNQCTYIIYYLNITNNSYRRQMKLLRQLNHSLLRRTLLLRPVAL
jgi:hypothetical protein